MRKRVASGHLGVSWEIQVMGPRSCVLGDQNSRSVVSCPDVRAPRVLTLVTFGEQSPRSCSRSRV